MFEISFSNKAEKFLKQADKKLFGRLKQVFEKLKETPVPAKEYDIRKIAGEEDTYRIRLSSHRTTYKVFWDSKQIFIAKIERRKESTYKA